MTYAKFSQACLENTLLTTQEDLSGRVIQNKSPTDKETQVNLGGTG